MKIKFSDRERLLLILAGVILVLYFFIQFVYLPKSNEIYKLSRILNKDKEDLRTAKEKEKLLQSLEENPLQKTTAKKTKNEQIVEALKHLSPVITRLKLDLVSMRPRNEEMKIDSANAINFDIEFKASYNNVYKFLKALESLPILILVDSIDLKRIGRGIVAAKFILSVYY
ncbi:type II secretion system protein M [Candidatus Saganbacteria bacterium]|nr:type II secretion system protein M [Candidatus Saganbacteria bacterium]